MMMTMIRLVQFCISISEPVVSVRLQLSVEIDIPPAPASFRRSWQAARAVALSNDAPGRWLNRLCVPLLVENNTHTCIDAAQHVSQSTSHQEHRTIFARQSVSLHLLSSCEVEHFYARSGVMSVYAERHGLGEMRKYYIKSERLGHATEC